MNRELTVETIFKIQTNKKLNIIHFNDVYSIEENEKEPKAGASRFVSLVEELIQSTNTPTLVLFSGDAISPSNGKIDSYKISLLLF
jgi:2',3'-cyclic-nucleotide 2'-phosphodiesterase (5'-nucleotidase family)